MKLTPVNKAKEYAKEAHGDQTRNDGVTPYVTHTQGVAELVMEHNGSPIMVAAAHLHDTIEDTDVRYGDIVSEFGIQVAELVRELTNVFTKEDYPDWDKEKLKNFEVRRLATISPSAKLIKRCDIEYNSHDNPKPESLKHYARVLGAL